MSSAQYGIGAAGSPQAQPLSWSRVLNRTYGLYAQNFWAYFRIALLPMIVAFLVQYAAHAIFKRFMADYPIIPEHMTKFYLIIRVNEWINSAAYWIISAFFCAAIAATFQHERTGGLAVSDAYTLPRRRLGAVVTVALLTSTLFFLGRSLLVAALEYLMMRIPVHNYWLKAGVILAVLLALAGLVARWGLAIPALMQNPEISIREALRMSLRKTENWETFFMFFLAKTAIVAYIAYWIIDQAMEWAWQHPSMSAGVFTWLDWALYICFAAALESPLFIAFSVLHQELQERPQEAATTPQTIG